MMTEEMLIVEALRGHVRVNTSNKTVEIFNEYGTKAVLKDLDNATFAAFASKYQNF